MRDRYEADRPGRIAPNKYHEMAWIIGNPEIAEDVWIGAFCVIDGSGGLKIGASCNISCGVHILTHDTTKRCVTADRFTDIEYAPVEIGDHVFIGEGSFILPGSTIGHHTIIGAGSLMLGGNIPPYSVAMGHPIKGYSSLDKEALLRGEVITVKK